MGKNDRRGRRKSREQARKIRTPKLGYYYIVTDTDRTEKNYFEGLRDSIPEESKKNIVIKVTKSETVDLVNTCKNGMSLYPQYCEPWIVFDRDQVIDFDKIIDQAEKEGIHAGWSNPCFEIWLYAYFENIPNLSDSVGCCKKFSSQYQKRTKHEYDKAEKDLYAKLNTFGDEGNAIKRAQKKRQECSRNGLSIPSKMIPCTMVDVLVNEIRSKVNKTG